MRILWDMKNSKIVERLCYSQYYARLFCCSHSVLESWVYCSRDLSLIFQRLYYLLC